MNTLKHALRAGALLVFTCALARPAWAVAPGDSMPKIGIKPYSGAAELSNASLQGKVTVVNFWATWCAACKVELLEMEDQFKPYLAEAGFQVAFVSLDKEGDKAAAWFQENLKEPELLLKRLYLDGKFEAADLLKVDSFPMTLVIGKDGKVAYVQRGYKEGEQSTAEIVKTAAKLLGKSH